MKKRYIVFIALTLSFLLAAFCFSAARERVVSENVRDFAAERYGGGTEEKYTQLGMYCTDDKYLTVDRVSEIKHSIDEKLLEKGVIKTEYPLCASRETTVGLSRDIFASEAVATVYYGDYFMLHGNFPIEGGYVADGGDAIDYCVIDDLAAWRMFGSTDVLGMTLFINERAYTVSAVVEADRGEYAQFYGERPRVYIQHNSAGVRSERVHFTSLEAVLPDPITDFARDAFSESVKQISEKVYVNTHRFEISSLWDKISGIFTLGVMEGEVLPYYENISRVMETKCALLLFFELVTFSLAAASFVVLAVLLLYPVHKRLKEKRAAKKRHY